VYEKVEAYSFLSFGGVGDSKVKYFETDCFWAFFYTYRMAGNMYKPFSILLAPKNAPLWLRFIKV
jgi:hypothetical protein